MSVEIYGHLTFRDESEVHLATGQALDTDYIIRQAREHEYAGFDGVLVGLGGDGPESLQIAAQAAANTNRLNFLVAYRPGLASPTLVARSYATLDQFSRGRIRLHAISGRNNDGLKNTGDTLTKGQRYGRTREFIQLLKKTWTAREKFAYPGEYFTVNDFVASVFPYQQPRIPIYFAGNSEEAYAVGAAEADGYALYAQPLAQLREDIARIHAAARESGREDLPRIIVLVRLIIGQTDELAWQRAEEMRATVIAQSQQAKPDETRWLPARDGRESSAGDLKQVAANQQGERHDKALWTGLSGITQRGKSTALVGSPETIVAALADYVEAGVSTFILDGFQRLRDVPEIGNYILPRLRERLNTHPSF
ncbi:LLM class flavin-dependent oxidoreductase [Brenneria corticis]|uniref:Alkanesulfonate monooxygenase n=1 Tax=Brenneria corticis TaxID=2173106 RepID=A0A2U1UCY8_9GAMM|nr:LLM class flavin-dependent oxidoreductase [Brenneria sp. CFCC 11842]PWC19535.1 alkanesulfonate monooxygenase [Brenneria sp. CFCC 11842]